MKARGFIISTAIAAALAAGGCAQDGAGSALTTSAVAPDKAMAKTDPACAALTSQIEALRKDTTVENLEKAATGKSKTVQVNRAALGKQAELNKANADFQAKCAPAIPKAQTAQAAPQAAAPAAAKAAATQASATAKAAATTAAVTSSPANPVAAAPAAAKDAAAVVAKGAVNDAVTKAP
jgi:hypothetical protein